MSKTLLLCLFALGLLLSTASAAHAQYATTPQQGTTAFTPDNQTAPNATQGQNSNVVTLSGCLGRGAGADEYTLYGQTANSWELRSNSVDLVDHLGQDVTITAIKPANNQGSLIVTSISMVSDACSRH